LDEGDGVFLGSQAPLCTWSPTIARGAAAVKAAFFKVTGRPRFVTAAASPSSARAKIDVVPIYEFYCGDCHRVFNFLSRSVNTEKRPACPRCGKPELARRVSSFAISKGRKEDSAAPHPPDFDETRFESVMESLASEAEGIDENDPRQSAALMRKLYQSTGMPLTTGLEEALRRMEAGESMEKIEEEMGDVFDDPSLGSEGGVSEGDRIAGLRRRIMPPAVDATLYEL
jgi:putative FmdB family regulatory protein